MHIQAVSYVKEKVILNKRLRILLEWCRLFLPVREKSEGGIMSDAHLMAPVALTDVELDAVAGGQRRGPSQNAERGFVNANVNVQDVVVGVAAQVIGENLGQALGTGG